MRKNISRLLPFLLLAGLGGCSKSFVEQTNPNGAQIDAAYKTEADVATGLYGVYQALRSSNCVGEGAQLWTDDRADDINTTDNQSNIGEPFQFTAFSLSPSNSYLLTHWTALYTPINRANIILSVIDKVTFASDATKAQYKGELQFIRAYMYFNLVREFGDVPVSTERLKSPAQANDLTFRVKREEVYAQIVKDLKDALNSGLPVVQPAGGKGRVSMQAVNALLGQVYLTMGATLSGSKTENLANAKTYLQAAYDQRTFTTLSTIPFPDVFSVARKSTSPEIIWQIVYKQGDATYSSSLARNNQAKGDFTNTEFKAQGSGGLFTKDLLKEFETGDVRTTFSVKFSSVTNQYFITKFRDSSDAAGTNGYGGNDWILIRYADVILNMAELYMLQGDDATAITWLDMVRTRAGRPGYADMMANDATYAARYPTLKLAILHERRVELAFEHHRWHDLVRFFTPEELVAYFKAKNQADYDNSPLSNITTKDYYFPIPLAEYNLNPEKMYQNPGY